MITVTHLLSQVIFQKESKCVCPINHDFVLLSQVTHPILMKVVQSVHQCCSFFSEIYKHQIEIVYHPLWIRHVHVVMSEIMQLCKMHLQFSKYIFLGLSSELLCFLNNKLCHNITQGIIIC